MKLLNALIRDDTVHGVDYYAAKEVDAIIADLTRERTHANDCFDAANEEVKRLTGESAVLRDLLAESLSVIKTIDGADECECDLLESLCDKINAAITSQAETGDLL